MSRPRGFASLLVLGAALLAPGCVLLFEDGGFQSMTFHFTVNREVRAGQPFDVETLVHPIQIGTRKHFAQLSGRLAAPAGGELPQTVELIVVTATSSGKQIDRIRKTLAIREDGGFKESQKLRKDIPAGAVQHLTIEPRGLPILQGTKLWLCLDVVERRGDLTSLNDCSASEPAPPDEGSGVVVVQVLDNSFSPRRRRIFPGQTVRWVLAGVDTVHTVTAAEATDFDSGLRFASEGDFFEVTFGPEADNRTFLYYCQSHQDCCQMQGSILVGVGAPDPGDGY